MGHPSRDNQVLRNKGVWNTAHFMSDQPMHQDSVFTFVVGRSSHDTAGEAGGKVSVGICSPEYRPKYHSPKAAEETVFVGLSTGEIWARYTQEGYKFHMERKIPQHTDGTGRCMQECFVRRVPAGDGKITTKLQLRITNGNPSAFEEKEWMTITDELPEYDEEADLRLYVKLNAGAYISNVHMRHMQFQHPI
jgi:hypothetical protein